MTIKYFPISGFNIENNEFKWGEQRHTVWSKLNNTHRSDDKFIDLSIYFDGNKERNIDQKRDVYKNINNSNSFFFLNYDKNNMLRDVEIHSGIVIQIHDIAFSFDMNINNVIRQVRLFSDVMRRLNTGEYLFEDLKLVIADQKKMGGLDNTLGYVYFSNDISHLKNQ